MSNKLFEKSNLLDALFFTESSLDPRLDFDFILKETESDVLSTIREAELDDFLSLYDVGLRLVIEIRDTLENARPVQITYLVLISKVTTLLVGIRKAIHSGLPDVFKCLFRPLTEAFDMLYVCLIDSDFLNKYGNLNELYDNNQFWIKNAKQKHIKPKIHRLLNKLGDATAQIKFFDERRKRQHEFFSESLHSSFNSAISTFFTPTINGDIPLNAYGNVTTAYPKLFQEVLDELQLFNYVLFQLCNVDSPEPFCPQPLIDNKVYQHLAIKYHILYDDFMPRLYDFVDEINTSLTNSLDEYKSQE
ncbi:hypothetical protein [Paenibacillus durus]|uniref:Uncharacterized protein n=1 Tax=Paenibacillus durus TaxID=44251 RepID=A0A089HRA1_PAEDU|nr:hypothetical protein [Paenibacillus durus]AIQ13617.1 hypothetical protein PDUR_18085 [Paenibacillus durus]